MYLDIKNLSCEIDGKAILKDFSLQVNPGEIHAIMGPNGAGKSTLAKVLAGHPDYEITSGEILFREKNLLELEPEERAHLGMFMSFQYPLEIAGVTTIDYLYQIYSAKQKAQSHEQVSLEDFKKIAIGYAEKLKYKQELLDRDFNDGFSGGEKKRNEILQLSLLDPHLAILDETDSGLDIDALKTVAEGVNHFMNPNKALIVITHYQRLLDYIKPDVVHVMVDGKIIKSGNADLALELEAVGYESIQEGAAIC